MKDKVARGQIGELFARMKECEADLVEFRTSRTSIKDCPKCKHPVLAQWVGAHFVSDGSYLTPGYNQCLTCGTKFKCETKNVCEIVE